MSINHRRAQVITAVKSFGDSEYSYASYVFYGTMDTPDAKGDSVIIYMSDSGKSPYYTVKDSANKDNANGRWRLCRISQTMLRLGIMRLHRSND